MKNSIFFLYVLVLLNCSPSVPDKSVIPLKKKPVILSGKISEHTKYTNRFVQLQYDEISNFGHETLNTQINEDGSFQFRFDISNPLEFYLIYGENQILLFARPNDNIRLEFPAAPFFNEKVAEEFIKVSGDSKEMNELLLDIMPKIYEAFKGENEGDLAKKTDADDFKKYKFDKLNNQLQFLDDYVKTNDISNEDFKRWVSEYWSYRTAHELIWYGPRSDESRRIDFSKYDLPKDFFDFFERFPIYPQKKPLTAEYHDYLETYLRIYVRLYLNLPEKQKREKTLDTTIYTLNPVNFILKNHSGFVKDYLLTNYYLEFLNHERLAYRINPHMEVYFDNIETKEFEKLVSEKYRIAFAFEETPGISEKINHLNFPESLKNVLPKILEKHKGKLVYLDVWATWCGPCKSEMPFYPQVMEQLDNQDIAFVFMAAKSSKGIWKRQLSEWNLEGEHIFLTDNQYVVLDEILDVKGFPSHFLFDKYGDLINRDLPRANTPDKLIKVLKDALN